MGSVIVSGICFFKKLYLADYRQWLVDSTLTGRWTSASIVKRCIANPGMMAVWNQKGTDYWKNPSHVCVTIHLQHMNVHKDKSTNQGWTNATCPVNFNTAELLAMTLCKGPVSPVYLGLCVPKANSLLSLVSALSTQCLFKQGEAHEDRPKAGVLTHRPAPYHGENLHTWRMSLWCGR